MPLWMAVLESPEGISGRTPKAQLKVDLPFQAGVGQCASI